MNSLYRPGLAILRSAGPSEGRCGVDFEDGAGHRGTEVFSGGEGLADLGGQAAPFGDGERRADAAQRDFDGDVIAPTTRSMPRVGSSRAWSRR